jgi:hypothetical protein
LEEPNGDYDDDDGNDAAITTTTITTTTNPAPAAFMGLFTETEKGPFQGQHL